MVEKIYNPCGHNLLGYRLTYLKHKAELEKRIKKKETRKTCGICAMSLYEDEFETKPENVGKLPS